MNAPQQTNDNSMFVLTTAMLAHELNRAYCTAIGDTVPAQWDKCHVSLQQSAVNGALFWMEHPDAPPSAGHDAWMAARADAGWRLGAKKDEVEKTHPNMRPFEALTKEQEMKDILFRGVIKSVLYVQQTAPQIMAHTALVQAAMAESGLAMDAWNALPEEDRKARCDAILARSVKAQQVAAANGLKQEDWNALTEDQRNAFIASFDANQMEFEALQSGAAVEVPVGDVPVGVLSEPPAVGEFSDAPTIRDAIAQMQAQHEEGKAMPLPPIALLGYEGMPEAFPLTATVAVTAPVAINAAQEASALSCEDWNALPDSERREYITGKLGTMRIEAETAGLV